jgi:hypothetical protein
MHISVSVIHEGKMDRRLEFIHVIFLMLIPDITTQPLSYRRGEPEPDADKSPPSAPVVAQRPLSHGAKGRG